MIDEMWATIPDFPTYQVSSLGDIYNTRTKSLMRVSHTTHGHVKIALVDENGDRHTRSVTQLVAQAFCEAPNSRCNQVIVLDGDLTNLRADNLVWRPTWFAWRYTRQLKEPQPDHLHNLEVRNVETGVVYPNIIDAGVTEGLLFQHIWESTYRGKPCFPTGAVFEITERV